MEYVRIHHVGAVDGLTIIEVGGHYWRLLVKNNFIKLVFYIYISLHMFFSNFFNYHFYAFIYVNKQLLKY